MGSVVVDACRARLLVLEETVLHSKRAGLANLFCQAGDDAVPGVINADRQIQPGVALAKIRFGEGISRIPVPRFVEGEVGVSDNGIGDGGFFFALPTHREGRQVFVVRKFVNPALSFSEFGKS